MLIHVDSSELMKRLISLQIDSIILGFKIARSHPEAELKDIFKIKSEEYGKENATSNA